MDNFHLLLKDEIWAKEFFPQKSILFLKREIEFFFKKKGHLLKSRLDQGFFCDGHGDLHAGNICITPGNIFIYDRIEFSEKYRFCDVVNDIAFLAMDLDRQGFRAFSRYFIHQYIKKTNDWEIRKLINFYKTYRALVRAKVALLKEEKDFAQCRDYIALALSYHLPPCLLMTSGLPGSGKSFMARQLAGRVNAILFRSDVIRKELAGISWHQKHQRHHEIYHEDFTRKTYEAILHYVEKEIAEKRIVIVDAAFTRHEQQKMFVDFAREKGFAFLFLKMETKESLIRQRLRERKKNTTFHEVSDADESVYEKMKENWQSPEKYYPTISIKNEELSSHGILLDKILDKLISESVPEMKGKR
jgi:predicted kinase